MNFYQNRAVENIEELQVESLFCKPANNIDIIIG